MNLNADHIICMYLLKICYFNNMRQVVVCFCGILAVFVSVVQSIPEVTPEDFDGSFIFLQLYSPQNCASCSRDEEQLEKVSKLFKGIVNIGKLNVGSHLALKQAVSRRNPNYFLVKGDIKDYVEYDKKISRIAVSKFILDKLSETIKSRDSELFGSAKPNPEKKQKKSRKTGGKADASGVIVVDDSNFKDTVLGGTEPWFVQFYSPSCGHCQALQPEWDKLPKKIGKRVNIAKIDATKNREMAQKYQIKGFPTLLLFTEDKKQPTPYQSERTAQAMAKWLQSQPIGEQKLEFTKLTKQSYDKQCNRNIVCLIFILDGKSDLKKLDFIQQVMQEQNNKALRFFYSPKLQHFEQQLMIDDRSTPKLVSVWDSINSIKVYNGAINQQELTHYIQKIMERRSWIKYTHGKVGKQIFTQAPSDQL